MKNFNQFIQKLDEASWESASHVVAKKTLKGQKDYFNKFPERVEFFQNKHPDMAYFSMSKKQSETTKKVDPATKKEKEKLSLAAAGGTEGGGVSTTAAIKAQGAGAPKIYTDAEKKEYAKQHGLEVSSSGATAPKDKVKQNPLVAALMRSERQKKMKQKMKSDISDKFSAPEIEQHSLEEADQVNEVHIDPSFVATFGVAAGAYDHLVNPLIKKAKETALKKIAAYKKKKADQAKQPAEVAVTEDLDRVVPEQGTSVKVVGNVEHSGKKGKIVSSNKDGSFHVVQIGDKTYSFHGSNIERIKEEAEQIEEMDKESSSSRGEEGLPLGREGTPITAKKAQKDALKALNKALITQYSRGKKPVKVSTDKDVGYTITDAGSGKVEKSGTLTKKDISEESEQIEERNKETNHAPVAPTIDRKYVKGTSEWKAHKEKSKPRTGHPTNQVPAPSITESTFDFDESNEYLNNKKLAIRESIKNKLASRMGKK